MCVCVCIVGYWSACVCVLVFVYICVVCDAVCNITEVHYPFESFTKMRMEGRPTPSVCLPGRFPALPRARAPLRPTPPSVRTGLDLHCRHCPRPRPAAWCLTFPSAPTPPTSPRGHQGEGFVPGNSGRHGLVVQPRLSGFLARSAERQRLNTGTLRDSPDQGASV